MHIGVFGLCACLQDFSFEKEAEVGSNDDNLFIILRKGKQHMVRSPFSSLFGMNSFVSLSVTGSFLIATHYNRNYQSFVLRTALSDTKALPILQ